MKINQMTKTDDKKSWDTLPLTLTAADTAAILGISRESVYDLFGINAIPTVMVGKRRRVSRDTLRNWLEG